jgi:non-ribosomal peptide synthetase component F
VRERDRCRRAWAVFRDGAAGLVDALADAAAEAVAASRSCPRGEARDAGEASAVVEVADARSCIGASRAQAARARRDRAVVCGDERVSYGELNARANALAHRLIAMGVRPDDRVALCLERGVGLVVGVLAILKAGAGYVPLDPAYPAERLAFMLEDCAPVALVTDSTLLAGCRPWRSTRCSSTAWRARTPRRPIRSCPASARGTWPTSSTPPAPPAGPRA